MAIDTTIDYRTAKGWLKDGERELLFQLSSQLRADAVVLNIGVEFGASLACLRAGNATARIIGLDLNISKAVSTYGCELVQVDSHEAVKTWDTPLDLIFVDGDHGEIGVLLDARFADYLKLGNYVLFQDCWDWENSSIVHQVCPGVNAAVDKWFAGQAHWEFEELPSVDTTRVFKRVREHEQPGMADSSGIATDLRTTGSIEGNNKSNIEKPQLPRANKNISR